MLLRFRKQEKNDSKREIGGYCHRSVQNHPPRVESKSPTLLGGYVGCFELWFKVDFVVFVRGSGDRALQECNPSTGSSVDCESIPSRFELTAGPGFFFGVPVQATV